MKKQSIYFGLLVSLLLVLHPIISFSEEASSTVINGFSYEVVFPENQQNKEVGYYDLLMKAGETQTIQLKVKNTSNQAMKLEIHLNSAKTNGQGVIEYGSNDLPKDPSLKHDLADIMKGPEKVEIPANSSSVIPFVITLPKEAFEGYLTGGIQLKPILEEAQVQNEQNEIVNKFAFLIGVLIRESAVDQIKPELTLNDISLRLKEGTQTLFVNLSNTKGAFVENMSATIQITEKGSSRVLFEEKKNNLRMAPNSMIDLPVSLNNQAATSGEYTANIQMDTENGGNWTWLKNFKVSKVEAQRIKQPIIKKLDRRTVNYWWVLGLIATLLVSLCIGILVMKKKWWFL